LEGRIIVKKLTAPTPTAARNANNNTPNAVWRKLQLPTILLLAVMAFQAKISVIPEANASPAPQPPAPVIVPAVAQPAVPTVVDEAPAPEAAPQAAPAVLETLSRRADGLSPKVLRAALDAMQAAKARGVSGRDDLLTVIDYTLPSTQRRLWVLDLAHGEVLYHELVAHGSGSGENYATRFSNVNDSRQTSLGLFLTAGTYEGGNGYSLVLRGLDKGINDRAEERHIVMHGAWYVSAEQARAQGRIGRSWGCPALSSAIAPAVIDTIKGGSFIYSYGPSSFLPAPGGSATTATVSFSR
jgi:hypothetical protein